MSPRGIHPVGTGRPGRRRGPAGSLCRETLARRGFSLIELMVTLLILGVILVFAIHEYEDHIMSAKIARCRNDLEDLAKAVRWYNIREEKPFTIGTFTPQYLGAFIGTYLETAPPKDPWGQPFRHQPDLGVIYSCGPNMIDETADARPLSDDLVHYYLPADFYITKAEFIDATRNNQIDFGDEVEITFSRPARMEGVSLFDFVTVGPENAFGSAKVMAPAKGTSLKIVFSPPLPPKIRLGETRIKPYYDISSVVDCGSPPRRLGGVEAVVIQRRKM